MDGGGGERRKRHHRLEGGQNIIRLSKRGKPIGDDNIMLGMSKV